MRFDAVIFDLDGTLLDTLGDIRNAANHVMDTYNLPHHSLEAIRTFIGGGAKNLIKCAMPADATDEQRKEALKIFQAYYNTHLNIETTPYPGITEMLNMLCEAGIKVCVNSNKYDDAVHELCAAHFAGKYLYAAGESADLPRKPDPAAALKLTELCKAAPEKTLYVGDSDIDIKTALNGNMVSAWVSWGFRDREDLGDNLPVNCFDTAESLTDFILGK